MLSVGREIDLKIFCLVRILKHIGDKICRILRYNTVLPELVIDTKRKMMMIKDVSIYHDVSFVFDTSVAQTD